MSEWPQAGGGWGPVEASALLAAQLLGPVFRWWQNRVPDRIGGPISLVKAQWFVFATSLWVVTPMLADGPEGFRLVCWVLAASMLLRGAIELWLCLVTRTWKTSYGVSHDVLQLVLAVGGLVWFVLSDAPVWALLFAGLTISTLLTEITFVGWFRKATAGPEDGVYFVPDTPECKDLNRRTARLFLPQFALYLALLLDSFPGAGFLS